MPIVERTDIEVRTDQEIVLKDGFHDEFDALEWLTNNKNHGNYTIVTTRRIKI